MKAMVIVTFKKSVVWSTYSMELLVMTLAKVLPNREFDSVASLRLISEIVKNAPGLVTARFYHSGEDASRRSAHSLHESSSRRDRILYFVILTTWEDEDFWHKAQERHNPKSLLLEAASEYLVSEPEQWLMNYLWGYSRPSALPTLAAAHLVTVRLEQTERLQRSWIECLQRQAMQPTMAYAFLAQSREIHHSLTFLNLLSWPNEGAREEFYGDPNYKALNSYLSSTGMVHFLTLETLD